MGDVSDKKRQFRVAGQAVSDNAGEGYVVTPDLKVYKISRSSRSAKPVTGAEADAAISLAKKYAKTAELAQSFSPTEKPVQSDQDSTTTVTTKQPKRRGPGAKREEKSAAKGEVEGRVTDTAPATTEKANESAAVAGGNDGRVKDKAPRTKKPRPPKTEITPAGLMSALTKKGTRKLELNPEDVDELQDFLGLFDAQMGGRKKFFKIRDAASRQQFAGVGPNPHISTFTDTLQEWGIIPDASMDDAELFTAMNDWARRYTGGKLRSVFSSGPDMDAEVQRSILSAKNQLDSAAKRGETQTVCNRGMTPSSTAA
jgi:hypothetical protein